MALERYGLGWGHGAEDLIKAALLQAHVEGDARCCYPGFPLAQLLKGIGARRPWGAREGVQRANVQVSGPGLDKPCAEPTDDEHQ